MIDLGISKLAMIGVVALIVIGPEKLPKVARTVGALLGKAQRYVSDVKAEVSRSIELEELKKMKESMEGAAKDVASSVQSSAADFEKSWSEATEAYSGAPTLDGPGVHDALSELGQSAVPVYKHPGKNWRVKQNAMPQWYKSRNGVKGRVQSGAARVARFRPKSRLS
ncbi:MAG TPA: Sec-independent protein translocase protein TatB [Burkholderiaceae bacterium]|nr:Sec-independent protein translocase protein TatB [Burkholderiaceae bacterium]